MSKDATNASTDVTDEEEEDLLNPDEIEALLNASGANTPPPEPQDDASDSAEPAAASQQPAEPADPMGGLLGAGEIEALMSQASAPPPDTPPSAAPTETSAPKDQPAAPAASSTEQILNQAEADLAAALAPDLTGRFAIPEAFGEPMPFAFQDFGGRGGFGAGGLSGLSAVQDVELDLRIELGRTELLIEEVLKLVEGSVVPLDKLAGDPVDILVNGRLIARGEVLVLNDNFCVRVAEILTPDF